MEVNDTLDRRGGKASRRFTVLMALLLATAGLRMGVIAARWDHLQRDPDAYRVIAENLRQHGVYSRGRHDGRFPPTAFRPPLYPALLAICARRDQVTAGRVALLHGLLGLASVFLAWRLADRWNLGRGSYLVAGLVACDPILLNQSTEVMTETLATFLALAALFTLTFVYRYQRVQTGSAGNAAASRRGLVSQGGPGRGITGESPWSRTASLMAGLVLGLASLCRPTFLAWGAVTMLWILVSNRHWKGVQCAACLGCGCVLVLAPWMIRNQQAMGKPIVATTHGGYTLLLGNNRFYYRHLSGGGWAEVWDARELRPLLEATTPSASAGADVPPSSNARGANARGAARGEHPEIVANRRLYRRAWKAIRANPALFVAASVVRIYRFWTPLPHRLSREESPWRTVARGGVAVWYAAVYLIALVGLWYLGRRAWTPPWVWGILCGCALAAVHTVYWSNMRMRAPAMPTVYLLFVAGAGEIQERVKRCKWFNGSGLCLGRGRETWVATE